MLRSLPLVPLGVTLLLLPLAACDPGPCPEDSTVTWSEVGPLFADNCISCHSSENSEGGRSGAPATYNYDTAEEARGHPNWTWAEISLGLMPPTGALDEADQETIREWLACGGPD